jgi:Flp pilus assembly protein TadD
MTAEGMAELARAVELAPDEARYSYVLAIGLNSTGQTAAALDVLRAAHDRRPSDRDVLLALSTINRDRGDRTAALDYARELAGTAPWDQAAQRLVAQLTALP